MMRQFLATAVVAMTSMFVSASHACAQGYGYYGQGYGSYVPSVQVFQYSSNRSPLYANGLYSGGLNYGGLYSGSLYPGSLNYGGLNYGGRYGASPYTAYSPYASGLSLRSSYRSSIQRGYSPSLYGGRGTSFSRSNMARPSRSGISIRFGSGGLGNRGTGLRRGF